MRLSCQKAFIFVLVATIGCGDTTAPIKVPAQFDLVNINGRQLPTYLAATPGLTATILWASLTLDRAGKAEMTEHRRVEGPGILTEATYTNTFDYRIHGDKIEIGSFEPCPINAICAPNMIGTISNSGLSLIINPTSIDFRVTYGYRIAPTL
jgi:hypothetical protein